MVNTLCGKEINNEAVVCVHCGCSIESKNVVSTNADAPNKGFAILGFLFPLVGLILYLVYLDTAPLKAKSAGKGALVSVVSTLALNIICGIVYAIVILMPPLCPIFC